MGTIFLSVIVLQTLDSLVMSDQKPREVTDTLARLQALEQDQAFLEATTNSLTAKYNELKEMTDNLNRTSDDVSTQIQTLRAKNNVLVDNLRGEYRQLEDHVAAVERVNAGVQRQFTNRIVAFHVVSNVDQRIPQRERVKFTNRLLDTANRFNLRSGQFTAPVSGTYILYYQTSTEDNQYHGTFEIKVNDQVKHITAMSNKNDFGSGLCVVEMNARDKVAVFSVEPLGVSHRANSTSFVGFLLYRYP